MGRTKELHIQIQDELINTIDQFDDGRITALDAVIMLEEEEFGDKIYKSVDNCVVAGVVRLSVWRRRLDDDSTENTDYISAPEFSQNLE